MSTTDFYSTSQVLRCCSEGQDTESKEDKPYQSPYSPWKTRWGLSFERLATVEEEMRQEKTRRDELGTTLMLFIISLQT